MNITKTPRRWRLLIAVAAALVGALVLFGAGCGDDDGEGDDESAKVEAAIRAITDAWNGKDVEGFLALVTDNFLATELEGASREEARQQLPEFIGEGQEIIAEITDIEVSGDTATAIRVAEEGRLISRERGTLVREGDEWKIDAVEDIGAEIPEGTTAVDLSAREYEFVFDEAAITSGDIAFNVTNDGAEQHFVFLAKVPEDLDIETALRSEEEPEGAEDIGGTEVVEPGDDTTIVFTEPLDAGRYVMLCFIAAPDGEEHALKGMWADFNVE